MKAGGEGAAAPVAGSLIEADLGMIAGLQSELFKASAGRLGPRDVDDLYFWECANLLGVGRETPATTVPGVPALRANPVRDDHAHLKARMAGQDFKWTTPDDGAALTAMLIGGTRG